MFTTFSQNLTPTIPRKAGHLSNTETIVKFCLSSKSPKHFIANYLEMYWKKGKKWLESRQHIMMKLEKLDTTKGVAQKEKENL